MKNSVYFTLRSFLRELVRGHIFRIYHYKKIRKNEYSEKYLLEYRNKRLRKILNSIGIKIKDFGEIKERFPIISKVDVKQDPSRYYSKKHAKYIKNYNRTSGTTGTPLEIKQSLECVHLEEAFVYRQMKWAGYALGDKIAWLRGDMVIPASTKEAPFWCRDYFMNRLMMSSYHISSITSSLYIKEMEKFNPVIIQAYPSSIISLARWLNSHDKIYGGKNLKSIIVSSELLEDDMKELIEERFNCKVYDWYGQAERVAAIGTCEYGNKHLLTDYSEVEISGYEKQEIIGTSLNNVAMPLIRYATGDFMELSSQKCECGRVFPVVKKIYGRVNNIFTLRDGREIAFLDHVFKKSKNVLESQIVYKQSESFVINVVTNEKFTYEDEKEIINNLSERVGDISIKLNICEYIPRGPNGKFEFVKVEKD